MDLRQVVSGIVLDKACSIKPDKDSSDSKTVTLKVRFEGVTLQSVFEKAVSGAVIQWQNGPGRSKFDQWKNHQVVTIDFKAPGRTTVDPEVAMKAKLAAMPKEERMAYINNLLADAE